MEKFLDYEFQVCEFHREENDETVWHWKHIPEEQLFAAGFITDYNRVRLIRRERMENEKILLENMDLMEFLKIKKEIIMEYKQNAGN